MRKNLSFSRPILGLALMTILLGCEKFLKNPVKTSSQDSWSDTPLEEDSLEVDQAPHTIDSVSLDSSEDLSTKPDSAQWLADRLISQGLVDVQSLAPAIQVDLKYASAENFLGEDVYHGLDRCFLQPEVARMLANAQDILSQLHPKLSLLVFDGVRPQSVQFRMWEIVKGTEQAAYVAEPTRGSLHNFGAAVDLGLVHQDSGELDMGTPYDFFGDLAQPRYEGKFLKTGELTLAHVENRRLLRTVMNRAGFTGILNEWWHFNAYSKTEIRERFEIVK